MSLEGVRDEYETEERTSRATERHREEKLDCKGLEERSPQLM